MATLSVSDIISKFSKFIQEAVEDYAEKNNISSFSVENLDLLTSHVVTYCKNKTADSLHQIAEFTYGAVKVEILEEETWFEQENCLEPLQIHQSSMDPPKVTSNVNPFIKSMSEKQKQQQEIRDKILKTLIDQLNQQRIQHEHSQQLLLQQQEFQDKILKTLVDQQNQQHIQHEHSQQQLLQQQEIQEKILKTLVDQLNQQCIQHEHSQQLLLQQQEIQDKILKALVDQPNQQRIQDEHSQQQLLQQQEFQDKILKTLVDQLNQQHIQHEHSQQQLLQQQGFQCKLMEDFVKHAEMQNILFCQAQSKSKTEHPVHDYHLKDTSCDKPPNVETKCNSSTGHGSNFGRGSAEPSGAFAHFENTPCNESLSAETACNSFTGHSSNFGRGSRSFAHFGVTNRDKEPFQLFDCHELGLKFCEWFYRMLNSQTPSNEQERISWAPDMFWDDARFLIKHNISVEEYLGKECVSSKLLEMTQKQKLTFTPTLDSERFKCVNSRHGLVVVAVTGVMSNNDNYSAVFNQIFGLIKYQSSGAYKIKSLCLRVDNMSPLTSEPSLHVPPLQYTTEELQDFK